MNKYKVIALRALLLMVIFSELNSILQAILNPDKYLMSFPNMTEPVFYLSQLTHFAVLANCVMIWLWRKWAVWTNVVIGAWSIILVQVVEGALVIQVIILVATLGILLFSLLVLDRFRYRVNNKILENE